MAKLSALAGAFIAVAQAQQFEGYVVPYDNLGLSDTCFAAINVTVSSCPDWVARYTGFEDASFELLPSEQLTELCESTCRVDLDRLRTTIRGACNATDVVIPFGSIAYPPTFMADRYLFSTGLSCLKDPATNEYCDAIIAAWITNGSEYTSAQNCSACELNLQKLQLESPFAYSDENVQAFNSLTSSCSATGYAYSTPTSYALNSSATTSTTTTSSTSLPDCTGSYTVQANDTCVTISGAKNVSTYGLIQANALDVACTLISEGENLCLPAICTTYQLGISDTCDSLVSSLNITLAQLLAWNPIINTGCSNLSSWRGWYLCASSPGGTVTVSEGTAATTAAPVPTDAQPQSNTNCGEWHEVLADEDCSTISLKYGISLSDFYFLNPQVDSNCTNLWAKTSYCVEAVGNIATYSGYTVSTASYTFTRPAPTTYTPTPAVTATQLPTAPGTLENCISYENAFSQNVTNSTWNLNACDNWARLLEVTVADLVYWNPSLSLSDCVFVPGYSYCANSEVKITTPSLPHDYCFAANTSRIASTSVQPSKCSCYIQIRIADQGVFNCTMFESLFNITVDAVTALNPWIGSDCDTGVWGAVANDGYEQICVEANSTAPTSSSIMTTASATSSSIIVTTPTATAMPDEASNCNKWHTVVSGDGCQIIANEYGITLSNFYSWNPDVGSTCTSLWLGYAVCVGVSS